MESLSLGNLSKSVNSNFVALKKGSSEIITLLNATLADETTIDRQHTRDGSLDTPSFPLIEITGDAIIDKDLYTSLRAMRQLSSRGALPTDTFAIIATNIGVSGDDFTETGTFILRRMTSAAIKDTAYVVNITLRLFNNNTLTLT